MRSSYIDIKRELVVSSIRLETLLNEKENLHQIYLGIHSPSFEEQVHTNENKDKVIAYLYELESKKRVSGLSLSEEIEKEQYTIDNLNHALKRLESVMREDDTIEGKLFNEIVFNGTRTKKAIRNVARKEYYSERQVWRIYQNIKSDIRLAIDGGTNDDCRN